MELTAGALSNLLPKLHNLLREEYNLQKRAKKNLQFLERELESMHITLRQVGNVPLDQLDEQVRVWARDIRSVSRSPDLKKVLKDLLCELDKGRHRTLHNSAWDEKQLIDQLREFLQYKRYFIVIDDIWDMLSWKIIRHGLEESNLGSCILTTTRNSDIADQIGGSYRLQPLNDENSRMLFYKRIFSTEDNFPEKIIEVSKNILKKCGGAPLAIITISSLLANKLHDITEWYRVYDSIGSGLENGNDMNGMRKILSLSYYDLPSHLKTCLLDLSTFPEDYEIRRERLVLRWMAEGFLQHGENNNSLFELGESYFFELINRSMIHPVDMDEQGKARACRKHDMVLDLICSLSREENFVNITRGVEESIFWCSKVRRLSLQENIRVSMNMEQMRSFTIFSSAINSMPSISCFHVVRVLDLEGCNLKGCSHLNLRYIGNLIHLRYLGLRHTFVSELPESIRRLQFLQTLDLSRTLIEELPSGIVQLRQLMYLSVNYNTRLPNGLRNMTSLEVLETVRVDEYFINIVKDLGHLSQLRVVHIDFSLQRWEGLGDSMGKDLMESLNNLQKIQSLEITDFSGEDNHMKEGWVPPPRLRRFVMWTASSLSAWINPASLLLLSYLDMEVKKIGGSDIQILGMLPSLHYLWLGVSSHIQELPVGERSMVSADAFPFVKVCKFFNFVTVPSMFPRGAMPRVEHLEFCLRPCHFFTPDDFDLSDLGMEHLPSLERVVVNLHSERADNKEEVTEVENGLRHAACLHPNYPSIDVRHH